MVSPDDRTGQHLAPLEKKLLFRAPLSLVRPRVVGGKQHANRQNCLLGEAGSWLGYLQEFPDYWTQGDTLEDLETHLRDLYQDLTSGELPGTRRVADIAVA